MRNSLKVFVIALLVLVLSGMLATGYWAYREHQQCERFILKQVLEHESASIHMFYHHSPSASIAMQVHFAAYVHEANERGFLDQNIYHRAMVLALMRMGIGYMENGQKDLGQKTFKIISIDISRWNEHWNPKKIRQITLSLRRDGQIPESWNVFFK